jgi:hypothetical protein
MSDIKDPNLAKEFHNFVPTDSDIEESQESLMRQEELRDRKNKILQLLNGEISDSDAEEVEQEFSDDGFEESEPEECIAVDIKGKKEEFIQPKLNRSF